MLTAMVSFLAGMVSGCGACYVTYIVTIKPRVDWWRGEYLRVYKENGNLVDELNAQRERFDDLVARNVKEMKEPLTHSFIRLPPWNKAVEVYGRTVNNRDILIARFDTPDPEYNSNLAEDLCEKLNEKPV